MLLSATRFSYPLVPPLPHLDTIFALTSQKSLGVPLSQLIFFSVPLFLNLQAVIKSEVLNIIKEPNIL